MRKIILITMAAIFAVGVMAQQKMRVWKNNSLAYEEDVTQIDSITFYDEFEGALNGEFSVSSTQKVRFSKGNVQYDATNQKWRFAERQYDYTANTSYFDQAGARGWIDMFGWGTGDNPLNNNNNPSSYSSFVDWGVNFSNEEKGIVWRTLSVEEWNYLFSTRDNHESLLARANIEGVNGLILFPDEYNLNNIQIQLGETSSFLANTLNEQQWNLMQDQGAVFLPAAGWVNNDQYQAPGIYDFNVNITYWTSTPSGNSLTYAYGCNDNHLYIFADSGNERSDKHSVRLVINVK